MKHFILTLLLAFGIFSGSSLQASQWSLADMNRTIDQTNFVVNRGCSGTLISVEEKLILTNFHCIQNLITFEEKEEVDSNGHVKKIRIARLGEVIVEQHGYNGFDKVSTSTYYGDIVAHSKKVDLAIIKIKSNILHTVGSRILPADQELVRGERVYIVGNPAGQDATVVEGIVSNLNRSFVLPWADNERVSMVQFSGGIYGGNSGGALYNSNGYLVGVPAAGHSGANFIGLAIPIVTVRQFLRDNCLGHVYDSGLIGESNECRVKKERR